VTAKRAFAQPARLSFVVCRSEHNREPGSERTVEPWKEGETPEEQDVRRKAYERLVAAFRRAGVPLERLGRMLGQVAQNEAETRDFLRDQVYGVPDDMLDDLVRIRMAELEADGDEDEERGRRS
jgi:hypothetical protein